MNSEGVTALVLGCTGAIGKELVKELIKSPRIKQINLITRREFEVKNPKIVENIVDFENLSNYKEKFVGTNVAFCCMGTTRAKSGVEGFIKVDRDYVHEAARILKEVDCSHFSLVSSKGSNINSSFLYMKTKGKKEFLNLLYVIKFIKLI
ncbi:UNVERIFIED_CONTAM: hypothetical protein GTU68_030010 [Idotea baltica]|nr:hypothetical protein [Idotea baltica]